MLCAEAGNLFDMSEGLFGRMPAAVFGKLFVRDADKARALAASGGDPAEAVMELDADIETIDSSSLTNGCDDFEVGADEAAVSEPVFEDTAVEAVEDFEVVEEAEVEEAEVVEVEETVSEFVPAPGFESPAKRGRPKKPQA